MAGIQNQNNLQNMITVIHPPPPSHFHSSPVCGCSDHFPICITWLQTVVKVSEAAHKDLQCQQFTHFDQDVVFA